MIHGSIILEPSLGRTMEKMPIGTINVDNLPKKVSPKNSEIICYNITYRYIVAKKVEIVNKERRYIYDYAGDVAEYHRHNNFVIDEKTLKHNLFEKD